MTTENDNISPDDALPNEAGLRAALNEVFAGFNSSETPAPSSAPGASQPTSTSSSRPSAPSGASQRPSTGSSVEAEIARLEASEAWAKGDPGTLARLRELYTQQADAPAPAPAQPHPQQQRAQASRAVTEKRIGSLEASEAWRKADHPDHAKVMSELRQLYQQANPSSLSDELPHISDLRRATGTEGPKGLPSVYAERWNADSEAEFLFIGQKAGISNEALQRCIDWYVSMGTISGRFERGFSREDEQTFIEAAPSLGLPAEEARGIVAWFRSVQKESQS